MKVAWPPLSGLVANAVEPSLKVTVPVGVPLPEPEALTVAVKVTTCPYTDGLAEEARAVVLPDLLTVWLRVEEVLPLKLSSPLYTAVIECDATLSPLVTKVACPPLRVPVPMTAPLSLKVTVPLGVPLPGATAFTVAVKVTAWPDTEGLAEEPTAVVVAAALTVWVSDAPVLSLPVKLLSPL